MTKTGNDIANNSELEKKKAHAIAIISDKYDEFIEMPSGKKYLFHEEKMSDEKLKEINDIIVEVYKSNISS
jgi:hypothetical protein